MSFVCTQFKCQTVVFDLYIGPYQVLPLQARVDLRVIAMKGYSTFPKAPALLETHNQIASCHIRDSHSWLVNDLTPTQNAVDVFYNPSR